MNYVIENQSDIYVKLNGKKPLFQDSNRHAFIYQMDGEEIYYLIPQSGQLGLKIFGRETVDSLLELPELPIPNPTPNAYEKEKKRIIRLEESKPFWLRELSDSLNIELKFTKLDESYYELFDKAIKRYGQTRIGEDLFIQLSVYIGEILKNEFNGGKWVLRKEYGIDPYFYIYLNLNGKIYEPCAAVLKSIYKIKNFSLKLCLINSKISYNRSN